MIIIVAIKDFDSNKKEGKNNQDDYEIEFNNNNSINNKRKSKGISLIVMENKIKCIQGPYSFKVNRG